MEIMFHLGQTDSTQLCKTKLNLQNHLGKLLLRQLNLLIQTIIQQLRLFVLKKDKEENLEIIYKELLTTNLFTQDKSKAALTAQILEEDDFILGVTMAAITEDML